MKFKPTLVLLIAALFIGSCGGPGRGGCQSISSTGRLLGNQAPNFTLSDLAGEPVELAGLVQQKPTLLVFWATWCPTCVEEVPILNEWTEILPGLQIVGVNVQEPRERVQAFVEKYGVRYPILLDEEASVAHQYGLVGIPAAILIAKGGRVLYYGFSLPKNIERLIKE